MLVLQGILDLFSYDCWVAWVCHRYVGMGLEPMIDIKAPAEVVEANPIVTDDILDVVAGLFDGTASIIIRAIR